MIKVLYVPRGQRGGVVSCMQHLNAIRLDNGLPELARDRFSVVDHEYDGVLSTKVEYVGGKDE